jgi:HD-GYP domain-containing protein (c-di-GMP phosphodiesterase class II)
MIEEGSGTQFDPDVVAAFLSLAEQFRQTRAGMPD